MFDPYHKWLGIPREEQPPNHYRLLGLSLFENDPDVIDAAANRQMAYLQGCATGTQALLSQRLLNEVAAARLCLLNSEKKASYDARLRRRRSGDLPKTVTDSIRVEPLVPKLKDATETKSDVLKGIDEEAEPYEIMPLPTTLKRNRIYTRTKSKRPIVASVGFLVGLSLLVGLFVVRKSLFEGASPSISGSEVTEKIGDGGIGSPEQSASSNVGKSVEPSFESSKDIARVSDNSTVKESATFNGHAYKFFPENLSWHQANARCEKMGGHLATIANREENEFVLSLAKKGIPLVYPFDGVWLGVTDVLRENNWRWLDGSKAFVHEMGTWTTQ